jgi:hypothetical protein
MTLVNAMRAMFVVSATMLLLRDKRFRSAFVRRFPASKRTLDGLVPETNRRLEHIGERTGDPAPL